MQHTYLRKKRPYKEVKKIKERISRYIQNYMAKDSIFPNLQTLATAGNRFGLALSRQTIHNWALGKTVPMLTLLNNYILILQLKARDYADDEPQEGRLETKEAVWRSMAHKEKAELTELTNFFLAIREILNGN